MTTSHDERVTPRSGGRTAAIGRSVPAGRRPARDEPAGRHAPRADQTGRRAPRDDRGTRTKPARDDRATRTGPARPEPAGTQPRHGVPGGRVARDYPTAGSAALNPLERPVEGIEPAAEARAGLRVAPPAPVATPRAPFILLVLSVVVTGVLGILVLNTKINENAFRLHDLQQQQTALDVREQQLSEELAERESPGNLHAAANRLGLIPAGTPAFIRLPDGRVLGVPQPAVGQPSITSHAGG